ncbi:MAG: Release factor glutamine methyltransferase [Pseudomonadota bacterium]
MNVSQCLKHGQVLGLPRLEAQILLLHALGRTLHDRAWLLAHDTEILEPSHITCFESFAQRRLLLEPVAYIVGQKEFFGLTLQIDKRVLDPRDDTEVLVEWALACASGWPQPRFLDLGTGSGAIALALKSQQAQAQVTAVDASGDALSLAALNAKNLSLDVNFLQSDWLTQVKDEFEVIVSNPPYIDAQDPHLIQLIHEPIEALVSQEEGLADIQQIILDARPHLVPGGWLLIEHGWQQAPAVRALLAAAGYQNVQSQLDLAGIERCSGGQK